MVDDRLGGSNFVVADLRSVVPVAEVGLQQGLIAGIICKGLDNL
jgi:hypothetical protein